LQLAEWGADGVIIGSKVVRLLGEAKSPEEGLRAVEEFSIQVRAALG
jgi:tryptophan synthase alpha chain